MGHRLSRAQAWAEVRWLYNRGNALAHWSAEDRRRCRELKEALGEAGYQRTIRDINIRAVQAGCQSVCDDGHWRSLSHEILTSDLGHLRHLIGTEVQRVEAMDLGRRRHMAEEEARAMKAMREEEIGQ